MQQPPQPPINKLSGKFDFGSTGRLMLCSATIGLLAGLLTVVYFLLFGLVETNIASVYHYAGIRWVGTESKSSEENEKVINEPQRTSEPINETPFLSDDTKRDLVFGLFSFPRYWVLVLLVPAIGGLICGLIVYTFTPEMVGESGDYLIRTFHKRNGIMRLRVVPVTGISSIATIGTGGSAGLDAPSALIGAGTAAMLNRYIKVDAKDRRILLLAGIAGGISAIFNSPLGGAFYAVEILYCSTALEVPALFYCIISSLVGYAVSHQFIVRNWDILAPDISTLHLFAETPWIILFALLSCLIGMIYVFFMRETRNRIFARLSIPNFLRPALGGFLVGVIALFLPQIRGTGSECLSTSAIGSYSLLLLFALVFMKIAATSLTISSGGIGGLIAPSLFIGAMLGGAFGSLSHSLCDSIALQGLAPNQQLFIIIGMGAFLGVVGKIPF
ncbi:MAG: chloride channel protein, partial [Thermoguttaceae bacterium]